MQCMKFSFCIIFISILEKVQNVPKTYYFSLNKTTNEYVIRSRLDSIYSGSDNQRRVHLGELRNNVTYIKNTTGAYTHPLLDPEWNYNWKNITRQKLPSYIKKYHEMYSENMTGSVRFFFNAKPQNSTILRFNLSEINENITEAELHFYNKVDKSLLKHSLILRLYQMENNYFNETSLINPDAHKLLNVIYIYQAEGGWQTFKLTNALLDWFKNKTDLLLFITVSKPNEEQFSVFKDVNRDGLRTFMLLKSESIQNDQGYTQKIEGAVKSNPCQKHDFQVDFEKLNWMKFIIAPSEYNAFGCYGTCYRSHNLPNHIKITSFRSDIARKTLCCSSIKYSSLPIMFYDKNANVVIKIYEDMIVSGCACR